MSGASWWDDLREAPEVSSTRTTTPSVPEVVEQPPPPRSPRPPRPQRGLQIAAAVLAVVLLVMLGLLAARTLGWADDGPGGATADGTPSAGSAPGAASGTRSVASASPTVGTAAADAAAVAELQSMRQQGLAAHPPQGQWVAQLAAKSVGTTDPGQTAANGSSTFYASDILAQSLQIASGVAGGDVFVLQSTDFGDALVDARDNPYWVTLAAGPFGDAGDVQAWCDSMFASTPTADRGNACLPKQLVAR